MAPEHIPNAVKRGEMHRKSKREKAQAKLKRRMETKKAEKEKGVGEELKRKRLAANIPVTLDNSRVYDSTSYLTADPATLLAAEARAAEASKALNAVAPSSSDEDEEMPEAGPSTLPAQAPGGGEDAEEERDEEEEDEEEVEEQPQAGVPPKILITTSPGPSKPTYQFCDDIKAVFPGGEFFKRPKGRGYELGRVARWAAKRGYNALVVVNEDHKTPNAITLMNLPAGPTAYFKLTSVQLGSEIAGHARPSPHSPELILNNFTTLLGNSVGRLFGSLFPPLPQFRGRQVVTLHNQRDFLFFRRHRYMFTSPTSARLQEIGPRFTLKLRWLRKGLPTVTAGDGRIPGGEDVEAADDEEVDEQEKMDEDEAVNEIGKEKKEPQRETAIPALDEEQEYEWKWKPKMEVSRRTFFL
ncbi:ribosome production factor 1, partial [Tremellales sp. Uapishka_1]